MTLLQRPKMTAENNPVGLEPISRGLWAICRESGNKLDQNLDQLDRLEAKLLALLPDVYVELNGVLERHRVEPAQVKIVQRAGGAKSPFQAGVGSSEGSGGLGGGIGRNALSDLQQALRKQFGAEDLVPAGGSGNVTLDVSTVVMLNHLMDQLRGQMCIRDRCRLRGGQIHWATRIVRRRSRRSACTWAWIPGRVILTTTSRPSCMRAGWIWATDAAANGLSSKLAKSASTGAPNACSTMRLASSAGNAGTSLCNRASASR